MSRGLNFESILNDFGNDDPKIYLDKIRMVILRFQKNDLPHRVFFLILIPGAFVLWLLTNKLTQPQHKTESFEPLIERDLVLVLVATVTYAIMWLYLLPVATIFWSLFHTANWEYFFDSFFQWITFQAIVLVFTQVFFSKLAINSFELTKTFDTRYESLEELARAEYLKHTIAVQTRNRVLEIVPEIMQTLIDRSITAMIANGELNSASAQEVTRIMQEITRNILLNADRFDGSFCTTDEVRNVTDEIEGDLAD